MNKTIQTIVKKIIVSYGSEGITCDGLYRQASMVNGDFTRTQFDIAIARMDGTEIVIRGERAFAKQFVKVAGIDTQDQI